MSKNVNGVISWLRTWFDEIYAPISSVSTSSYIIDEKESLKGWTPLLNGETGANVHYTYSESEGEAIGKGFLFKNGFYNTDNWSLSFDFRHDNIRYNGIVFLADIENVTHTGGNRLFSWEGSWPGGEAYASYTSGEVGYFDVTVKKIDSTHVQLISNALNRDTIVEVSWLANARYLTFGTVHNSASSSFGPCRIKNIRVTHGLSSIDRFYPVGSIYMSVNDVNPTNLFGGTWERIKDRFLLGAGDTYNNGDTGGEANHTLTIDEMPSHNHTQNQHRHKQTNKYSNGSGKESGYTYTGNRTVIDHYTDYQTPYINPRGGGQAHNNMPPYLVVYMWKRTA